MLGMSFDGVGCCASCFSKSWRYLFTFASLVEFRGNRGSMVQWDRCVAIGTTDE